MSLHSNNCPILEYTGDGRCVGRCWAYVGEEKICPRHGDVMEAVTNYIATGKLTDDRKHKRVFPEKKTNNMKKFFELDRIKKAVRDKFVSIHFNKQPSIPENSEKLTDQEAQQMLLRLEKHFKEPVMPVSKYCKAIRIWFRCIEALNDPKNKNNNGSRQGKDYYKHLYSIERDISKSNLLYRLIYLKEELRTEKCPIHNGHWSGWFHIPCEHGCSSGSDVTGWIKK